MSGLPDVRFRFGILSPPAARPPGPIRPMGPGGLLESPGAHKPDIRYSWHVVRTDVDPKNYCEVHRYKYIIYNFEPDGTPPPDVERLIRQVPPCAASILQPIFTLCPGS